MHQFVFPAVKFRQFNLWSTHRRHPPALFPDLHVPSTNHPIPSTDHHIPSTNRYTASATLMLWRSRLQSNSSWRSPPIHPKPRPASRTTHKSVSPLTSPEIIAAAGPTTIIESQTPISAQPPQKRAPLKGWGVQHDGVSLSTVDYTQNYQDKFNEEYPEYAKAVLPTDLDEYIIVDILGTFQNSYA
ncbi:hypothetical protein DFH08DRAFT_809296 [Mycena albidolilacea]|uniref:Uncharacterized protein n=1 Tax=Mycena albidolilacea TaxID=1033008 RepID=A0AAD7A1M7_9AGAR|nr:hypothetical protein DFH08DRAFT_809296 [Mycena albidolilacea]